jgi:hypothetical protein
MAVFVFEMDRGWNIDKTRKGGGGRSTAGTIVACMTMLSAVVSAEDSAGKVTDTS